VLIRG
jgi:hypothetical protein